jgi:hypothetical protein
MGVFWGGQGDGVVAGLPMRFRHPTGELTFLSTISTFGTANDVTR